MNDKFFNKKNNVFIFCPNDVWFFGWKNVKNPDWNIDYLLKVANNMADFEMYYREIIGVILDSMKQEGML